MRALLVVNRQATTTSRRVRDVLIGALGGGLKLDVVETEHRGHAVLLAEQAAIDGLDLVVALGGDGTVNEVVNGLMRIGQTAGTTDDAAAARPALAVVPGGSANVFSRALDQPTDPVEATGALLEALQAGRRRTIGLGKADERYFVFSAGIGIDAEVVSRVEQRRATGALASPLLYARAALWQFFVGTERRRSLLRIELPDEPPHGELAELAMAILCNTAPWTYCGSRPLNPCPDAGFDTGLDLFALRKLRLASTVRALAHMASSNPAGPRGRQVVRRHDLAGLVATSTVPLALQLDGEYCGDRDRVTFTAVPAALTVIG